VLPGTGIALAKCAELSTLRKGGTMTYSSGKEAFEWPPRSAVVQVSLRDILPSMNCSECELPIPKFIHQNRGLTKSCRS
jgi:hypothetical protein